MPIYLLFMAVFTHCDKDSMTLKLKKKPLLSDPLLKKFANPCFKFKGNLLVLTVEDKESAVTTRFMGPLSQLILVLGSYLTNLSILARL